MLCMIECSSRLLWHVWWLNLNNTSIAPDGIGEQQKVRVSSLVSSLFSLLENLWEVQTVYFILENVDIFTRSRAMPFDITYLPPNVPSMCDWHVGLRKERVQCCSTIPWREYTIWTWWKICEVPWSTWLFSKWPTYFWKYSTMDLKHGVINKFPKSKCYFQ